MADSVFRRSGLLESGRRRFVGLQHQPPISLYYVQGLNLTASHGHAALFGVYGTLGIGWILFCLRGLFPRDRWSDGLLKRTF